MPGPTQVQSPPNDNFAQGHGHGHDLHEKSRHEGGPMSANAQHLHKEALRMALGSILNPKRPYTPSSRSSSGTASPAYPYSFHHSPAPGTPSIPPAPHPTPSTGRFSESHLSPFPYHPYPQPHLPHPPHPPLLHSHSQPHVPSRLSQLDTQSSPQDGDQVSHSQRNSPTHSGAASNSGSHCPSPILSEAPGTLSDASITAPANSLQGHPHGLGHAPASIKGAVVVTDEEGGSPSEKSKVTFIQTLQSKSAWEALIHGSFS